MIPQLACTCTRLFDASRILAQCPPRDRSTKHRDRQLDHLLATTRFDVLDSGQPSCNECVLRHALRSFGFRLNLRHVLPHCRNSRRLWHASVSTIVWIQYAHVLFGVALSGDWVQSTDGGWTHHLWDQLYIYAGCAQVRFRDKPCSDHAHCTFVDGSISWVGDGSCCGLPLG